MELVEGVPLKDLIKAQRLPLENCIDLILQVCDGLAAAHERSIVHRDIKPANILVSGKGKGQNPRLRSRQTSKRFRFDQHWRSTWYNCLHVARAEFGNVEVDQRSDIFSLGVVIYEMLSGQTPFKKDSEIATLLGNPSADSRSAFTASPEVGEKISAIVDRALQKDPFALPECGRPRRELRLVMKRAEPQPSQFPNVATTPQPVRSSGLEASVP